MRKIIKYRLLAIILYIGISMLVLYMSLVDSPPTPENLEEWTINT